jgi:hypothetical protein
MAEAAGISVSLVQHICKAHGLAPHHVRRFKLSRFSEPNQRTAAGEVRFRRQRPRCRRAAEHRDKFSTSHSITWSACEYG